MTPLGDWLTTQEAVKLTGYHINHVRRLLQNGEIQAIKFGNTWMINRDALIRYIEKMGLQGEKRGPKSSG